MDNKLIKDLYDLIANDISCIIVVESIKIKIKSFKKFDQLIVSVRLKNETVKIEKTYYSHGKDLSNQLECISADFTGLVRGINIRPFDKIY